MRHNLAPQDAFAASSKAHLILCKYCLSDLPPWIGVTTSEYMILGQPDLIVYVLATSKIS